jgi:uncharacterized protein YraI
VDVSHGGVAMAGGRATYDRVARMPGRWRRSSCVLALALIASVLSFALPSATPAQAAWGGTVTTEMATLRSEPGWWAEVVGSVYMGQWVEIVAGPAGDDWYQVASGGQFGWLWGGFISIDGGGGGGGAVAAAAATSGVGGGGYSAWVDTDVLNVRAGAGTDSAVVNQIWQGGQMTVVGDAVSGFLPIQWDGGSGWVSGQYLRYDGPPAASASGGGGDAPSGDRWIDVNRTNQTVTLMEGNNAVASYWGAFGYDNTDHGFYATAIGTYYVYSKAKDLNWTEWGQAYITDWVGFDPERANGFHSYSRDANGNVLANGAAATGGCVATEPGAAAHIFAFAAMGMRVEVHW